MIRRIALSWVLELLLVSGAFYVQAIVALSDSIEEGLQVPRRSLGQNQYSGCVKKQKRNRTNSDCLSKEAGKNLKHKCTYTTKQNVAES